MQRVHMYYILLYLLYIGAFIVECGVQNNLHSSSVPSGSSMSVQSISETTPFCNRFKDDKQLVTTNKP